MGEVWRAVDERFDRPVAVKLVPVSGDSGHAERFEREARAVGRLSSPHVVTVHDVGEADVDGQVLGYLVMELVRGRPLGPPAGKGPSRISDVVDWSGQICVGLQAAHDAGITHRDLKPANILLSESGTVILLDFGIARLAEFTGSASLTATGHAIGTPAYMSPEQIRGDSGLDARSDLYSLGCVMYELLTGVVPFEGPHWSVLVKHMNEQPRTPQERRVEIPTALTRLVLDLLAKAPDDRPVGADEVCRRLRAIAEPPTPARSVPVHLPLTEPRPRPRPTKRNTPPRATPTPRPDPAKAASDDAVESKKRPKRPGWPGTRAGAAGGTLVGLQAAFLANWSTTWATTLGATTALVLMSVLGIASLEDPQTGDDDHLDILVYLALAALVGGILLFWPSIPWWWALVASITTGPVLVGCSYPVHSVIRSVTHRDGGLESYASSVAAVNAVQCGLVLALGRGVGAVPSFLVAYALWMVVACGIGVLLPRPIIRRR